MCIEEINFFMRKIYLTPDINACFARRVEW